MNNTITNIKAWFVEAIPEPTDKNRAVQIGCHLEEVDEMQEAVVGKVDDNSLRELAEYFKKRCPGITPQGVDRQELLDALCDQIVTAVGVAHMFSMDIESALTEVNRSNWSKFVDGKPVFNEHGKIAKGPNYTEPDIAGFAK